MFRDADECMIYQGELEPPEPFPLDMLDPEVRLYVCSFDEDRECFNGIAITRWGRAVQLVDDADYWWALDEVDICEKLVGLFRTG